jgi:hypothetical protein
MDSLLSLANGNKDLRPFGSVEIYKDKKLIASSYGEFNKLGNDSWKNSQRGIDFECVDGMGYSNELRSKLFKLSERDSFQKVMFRPSGDDNYPDGSGTKGGGAHLRDVFIQNLVKKSDMQLDVRTGEKMILYINGKYWGVYDLRERVNDRDFIDFYYSHDRKDIQMLTTWGATTSKFNKSYGCINVPSDFLKIARPYANKGTMVFVIGETDKNYLVQDSNNFFDKMGNDEKCANPASLGVEIPKIEGMA